MTKDELLYVRQLHHKIDLTNKVLEELVTILKQKNAKAKSFSSLSKLLVKERTAISRAVYYHE